MLRSIMSDCRATSLLHKVQMARIFADSKTFVDMTIKRANISPNGILMYEYLTSLWTYNITKISCLTMLIVREILKIIRVKYCYTYCSTFLRRFDDLMANTGGEPDRKTLARFVEDHFTLENQLEEFEPQDWTDEPSILEVISGKSSSYIRLMIGREF